MAFADDIALYAYGYWSHERHPFRINSICLNTIQRKTPCTACTDTCPQDIVLHSGKANWTGCINCNLCVTACPTAAINQSATSFEGIRNLVLEGSAPVSFACERAQESCDVPCVCLATVPWDLCAAAALSSGVVLKAEACKSCPHEEMVAEVKELIQTLRRFLGKEGFAKGVFMHDQPDKMRSSGVDKRMAAKRVANSVAAGAETALEGVKNPTMSCYRALLLEVLENLHDEGTPAEVTWPTLIEDGNCHACEICTKMCPHKALELHVPGYTDLPNDDDEDVNGQPFDEAVRADTIDGRPHFEGQVLAHNASKCTQCGLCYVSCPNENLGGWDEIKTTESPAYQAFPINVKLCEKCGHPFMPKAPEDTKCRVCNRPTLGYRPGS